MVEILGQQVLLQEFGLETELGGEPLHWVSQRSFECSRLRINRVAVEGEVVVVVVVVVAVDGGLFGT